MALVVGYDDETSETDKEFGSKPVLDFLLSRNTWSAFIP